MKNEYTLKKSLKRLLFLTLASCFMVACSDDESVNSLDNRSSLVLTPSAYEIELKEDTPNEVALLLNWTEAEPISSDYYISYLYKLDLANNNFGTNTMVREYIDDEFSKSYTHKELQNLLVSKWKQQPGDLVTLQARIIGSVEGPKFVKPEISTISLKIKMYAEKAFMADHLFMSGTAVGYEDIEIRPMESRPKRYMAICDLTAGNINFPVVWKDENRVNTISPIEAEQQIGDDAMEAKIKGAENAGHWVIPEEGRYRVIVDFEERTVSIGLASNYIEADKIYISGTCVSQDLEMTRTIENENQYAFHAELNVGTIYFPILFNGQKDVAIAPEEAGDFNDGAAMDITTMMTETASLGCHWNIETAGVYRIVVNIEKKKVTIYSQETDPKPKEVVWVWNNNNITTSIDRVFIWGPYDGWASEPDKGSRGWDTGFTLAHSMEPSLADPYLFIYKGAELPRKNSIKDKDGNAHPGGLNFKVGPQSAGCYTFGSTADAIRSTYDGCIDIAESDYKKEQGLVEGQSHNRYAFFSVPVGVNYIELNIKNLTVVFDKK